MKTLFLECNMGAAGDMLMAALWELTEDKETALECIHSIDLPHTSISFDNTVTCGISCTKAHVVIAGEEESYNHIHNAPHHHFTLSDVYEIIDSLNISDNVKERSKSVYNTIAAAESKVHNIDVSMIHFHELGMLDAIADVVICCFLIEGLNVDKIVVSPINVGNGTVRCAHGLVPVPAPATAQILIGIPYYKSNIGGELCTPTGAAILKIFADDFSDMPEMTVKSIGYGAGSKEFEQANCIRAFLGEMENNSSDEVIELVCNVDDMTAEELSFACEKLFSSDALDVYTQPAYMKKGRLGTVITVMCREENKKNIITCIFKYTSTIGIREHICKRYVLDRKEELIKSPLGEIRAKCSSGFGADKIKYEFDDLKKIADEKNMSVFEVKKLLENNSLTN